MEVDLSRLDVLTFPDGRSGFSLRPLLPKLESMLIESASYDKSEMSQRYLERYRIVLDIAEIIAGDVAAGGSLGVVKTRIFALRLLFSYADSNGININHVNIIAVFIDWVDSRKKDVHLGMLKHNTLYHSAARIASLLARKFDLRSPDLLRRAGLQKTNKSIGFIAGDQHKQNLENTFLMGRALADICSSLSADIVMGPVPIVLKFRGGKVIEHWCRRKSPKNLKCFDPKVSKPSRVKAAVARRSALSADNSIKARSTAINLRIEAELLIFIAQTSMNLSQATSLRSGKFSYESYSDGYNVRRLYKDRRKGEVEFQIFSEYRTHFAGYLEWISKIFPSWDKDNGLIFPFVEGHKAKIVYEFTAIRAILKKLDITFVSPRLLRKTRINWLLRRSGDEELTAEQAQHARATLIQVYEVPHHQRAVSEITRFWQVTDPNITPPAPGSCSNVKPMPLPDIPPTVPRPDCENPAGCMFCQNHRDISSFDYVWSLASYRHLKTIEQAKYRENSSKTKILPIALVIQRLTEKLNAFSALGLDGNAWVMEALVRVDEDNFHPSWDGFIRLAEAGVR